MNIIQLTEPPVEPITLDEVYLHLRLDPDAGSPTVHPDDAMLRSHIKAARERCEAATRRSFVLRTLRLSKERFPDIRESSVIELLNGPVQEIVQIRYYDEDNAIQTLDDSVYFLIDDIVPLVQLVDGEVWPETYDRMDAVQVDYKAGYAPEGSPEQDFVTNIPASIKEAMKLDVQLLYDDIAVSQRTAMEIAISRLLANYKIATF